jgi:hypothetical protein
VGGSGKGYRAQYIPQLDTVTSDVRPGIPLFIFFFCIKKTVT